VVVVVEEPVVVVVEEPVEVVEPLNEDNDNHPILIVMGPGTQFRMKKSQIENVLNKIKIIINDITIVNRRDFEIKASMCVAEMLHEFANHNTRIPEYVYDLAISNGFTANTEVYMGKLINKVPTDYVAGGAKLAKFMWDYMRNEYDRVEQQEDEAE